MRTGNTIGLGAGRPVSAADCVVSLQLLCLPQGTSRTSCALALSSGGLLKLWQLGPTAADANLLLAHAPGAPPGFAADQSPRASYASIMAVCQRGETLAFALCSGGALLVSTGRASGAAEVAEMLRDWRQVAHPEGIGGAPLLKLSVSIAANSLELNALYGLSPPALYRRTLPTAATGVMAAWERVALVSDCDPALAVEDAASADQPEGEPLCSLTDFFVGRLLLPFRFAPRQLGTTMSALLQLPSSSVDNRLAHSLPQRLREGMDARVAALEATATLAGTVPVREECETSLGEGLLHFCTQQRADPAEILTLAHVGPPTGGGSGVPLTALVTRSSLTILQQVAEPPVSSVEAALVEAAAALSSRCMGCTGLSEERWGRQLTWSDAPGQISGEGMSTSTGPLRAAEQLLREAVSVGAKDSAAGGAAGEMWAMFSENNEPLAGASPQAKLQHCLQTAQWDKVGAIGGGRPTELLAHVRRLLEAQLDPASNTEWLDTGFYANFCEALRRSGPQPAAVAAQTATDLLCAAAAAAARRGTVICRGVMLLLLLGLERRPSSGLELTDELDCRRAPDGLLHLSSRLALAYELLRWLCLHAASALPATGGSALQQLLRAAALPVGYGEPLLDAAPCTTALIRFVLADVRLAQGAAQPGDHLCSMATLLQTAQLWRPLRAYLRRLNSAAPLHELLMAVALLRERRFEAAAESFSRVAHGAEAQTIPELRAALALPAQPIESEPATDEHRRQWELYQLLAAIWRAFSEHGQDERVLPFAEAALRLPVLKACAPRQCAALHSLVFSTALRLGRTRQAHCALLGLHAHATSDPQHDAQLVDEQAFEERRADCLRTLVSVLHERSCLHQLASLPFVGELHAELQQALLWHARSADVGSSPGKPNAYEVAYALRVRGKDYRGAANTMFLLAQRLESERIRLQPTLSTQAAQALLMALANAYGACVAALELLPAFERYLVEAGSTRADRLRAVLDAYTDSGGFQATTTTELIYVDGYDLQGNLDLRREPVDALVMRLGAELQSLEEASAKQPERATELIPVQLHQIRQRRALAVARAVQLVGGGRNDGGEPMSLAQEAAGSIPDAVIVLHALVEALQFDEAANLSLHFTREFAAYAIDARQPCGLLMVVERLAAYCVELAGAPGENDEWRRLRLLLERHDSEINNFGLSATAAKSALHSDPSRGLPKWLLDRFGAAPPPDGAERVLRVSAAVGGEAGVDGAQRSIERLVELYPAARAELTIRGNLGCGGDAFLSLPPAEETSARDHAKRLEDELRLKDPGCWPMRRNPAALCRALLLYPDTQLKECLRQMENGCGAACEEMRRWGRDEKQKRSRWVTCGLVDQLHAAVARQQVPTPVPTPTHACSHKPARALMQDDAPSNAPTPTLSPKGTKQKLRSFCLGVTATD